jgi:hypothetical protein
MNFLKEWLPKNHESHEFWLMGKRINKFHASEKGLCK